MKAPEILNEFNLVTKIAKRSDQELATEHLLGETYKIDGNTELLDTTLHWSIRASMAQQSLQKLIIKQNRDIDIVVPHGPQITQAQSAGNIKSLLEDPRLTKEQREALIDAAWFVAAAPDELDPEKIETDLKKQKLTAVANKIGKQSQDSVSNEYGRLRKKLEREGIPGDDLYEARKKMTLEYLEKIENNEQAKRELTNSRKDLHALELDIAYIRKNSQNLTNDEFSQAFVGVSAGIGAITQLAASGGTRQLYGRISQESDARITKAAGKLANKATSQFVGTAANAVLPGSGLVLGKIAGRAAEFVTDKTVGLVLRNKRKIITGAMIALSLPLLVLGGTAAIIGAGLMAAAAALVGTVIILPILLAFIIFIINSGAYIVPPSAGVTSPGQVDPNNPGNTAPVGLGDCPEGPSGWPVTTDRGLNYYVAQGPFSPSGYSHNGLEAIDVSYDGRINLAKRAIATHPGTVASVGIDSYGGYYVDIRGKCNGGEFRSRHVHMYTTWVTDEQTVVRGTLLGPVGDTGYATGKHDHYEFRAINRFDGNPFANSPLPMAPPYIPKVVPRGCVVIPCNVRVP